MGVYIPNMSKPKNCRECRLRSYEWGNEYVSSHHICHALCKGFNGRGFDGGRYINIDKEIHPNCPLIEIDLERDIPTVWYNRQTGQYEPKGTKQEVYERLYKLKNGERRE